MHLLFKLPVILLRPTHADITIHFVHAFCFGSNSHLQELIRNWTAIHIWSVKSFGWIFLVASLIFSKYICRVVCRWGIANSVLLLSDISHNNRCNHHNTFRTTSLAWILLVRTVLDLLDGFVILQHDVQHIRETSETSNSWDNWLHCTLISRCAGTKPAADALLNNRLWSNVKLYAEHQSLNPRSSCFLKIQTSHTFAVIHIRVVGGMAIGGVQRFNIVSISSSAVLFSNEDRTFAVEYRVPRFAALAHHYAARRAGTLDISIPQQLINKSEIATFKYRYSSFQAFNPRPS